MTQSIPYDAKISKITNSLDFSFWCNGIIHFLPPEMMRNLTGKLLLHIDGKESGRVWFKFPDLPEYDQKWHEITNLDEKINFIPGMKFTITEGKPRLV